MAAQILPFIDQAQQGLEQQRYAQQAQYQAHQQALQQAQFQNEQALQPLRQQLMQQELERGQQSMELTAKSFLSGQASQQQEMGLREQANSRAEKESDFNYGDHGAAIARYQNELLQNQLGTQQLDTNAKKLVEDRSSHLALLAQLPKASRLAALQPYADNSDPSGYSLGQKTVDQIMTAPEPAKARKNYSDFLSEQLGEGVAAEYDRLQNDLQIRQKLDAQPVDYTDMEARAANKKQLMADLAGIVKIDAAAHKGRSLDDQLGGIKAPDTTSKSGKPVYKWTDGSVHYVPEPAEVK